MTRKLLIFTLYTIILAKEGFIASEFKFPVLGKRILIDPVWVSCPFLVWPTVARVEGTGLAFDPF